MLALVLLAVLASAGKDVSELTKKPCPPHNSKMLCENCKCFGATKHTHHNITHREDCAKAAYDAGHKYYSWLRYGAELLCSFGTHPDKDIVHPREKATDKEACVEYPDSNTTRPWRIYELDVNTDNCACERVEVKEDHKGYKCRGFESIINWSFRKRKIAKSPEHCGLYAYKEGYETFSYLNVGPPPVKADGTKEDDTRWCMFGHKISSEDSCKVGTAAESVRTKDGKGAIKTINPKWSIYSVSKCNEEYKAYKFSSCPGGNGNMEPQTTPLMAAGALDPHSKSGHIACCTESQEGTAEQKCTVLDAQANCLSTSAVSYYDAVAACKANNKIVCKNTYQLKNCCNLSNDQKCGFMSKYYWTQEQVNALADPKQMP